MTDNHQYTDLETGEGRSGMHDNVVQEGIIQATQVQTTSNIRSESLEILREKTHQKTISVLENSINNIRSENSALIVQTIMYWVLLIIVICMKYK